MEIPGVSQRMTEILVSEIGVDMTRFGDDRHLASWAGMCPGQNESAGIQRSGKRRKGSHWLRNALTEAVQTSAAPASVPPHLKLADRLKARGWRGP